MDYDHIQITVNDSGGTEIGEVSGGSNIVSTAAQSSVIEAVSIRIDRVNHILQAVQADGTVVSFAPESDLSIEIIEPSSSSSSA